MHESKLCGMEHQARRRNDGAAVAANVDALAHDGVPCLREVDTDLVCSPGLEAAGDERARPVGSILQLLHDLEVRDGDLGTLAANRLLSSATMLDRAAKAVAAILDEVRANRP